MNRAKAQPLGAALCVLVQLLLLSGCGTPTNLTASGFVERINSEGVQMRLGGSLPRSAGAEEIHVVSLPRLPGEPQRAPGAGPPGQATGTLYVFGDSDAAGDQLTDCRRTGLSCYRASNIVVALVNPGIEGTRLGVAIRKLAD